MGTPCGSQTPFELLTDPSGANLYYAIQCAFTTQVSPATVAVFVFGTLGLMYFSADRSIVVPLVLAIMLGGIVVTALPAGAQSLVAIVAVFGVAVAVMYMLQRSRPVTP